MTYLLPAQLRRSWERLTHCPGVFKMHGVNLWCEMKWHPEGTQHKHDDLVWDWGDPPFEND